MKILSWNCQGLAKPKAVKAIRSFLKDSKPDVIFLCEVKTLFSTSISKALSAHALPNHCFVPPIGTAGGLILAWSSSINLLIELSNSFFIHAFVSHDSNSPSWYLTGIYCPCYPTGRNLFWDAINNLSLTFSEPWILIGDFNSITCQAEKKGGNPFASSSNNNFSNNLDDLGLVDLGFHGNQFTWTNKRAGSDNIQERLDRGVANVDWITLFPHASILHLPAILSDHKPLLSTDINTNSPKPFRFESMWLDDKTCFDTVHNGWTMPVFGSPSYKLHARIKNVKLALKNWNSKHFGNCHEKIKELKESH